MALTDELNELKKKKDSFKEEEQKSIGVLNTLKTQLKDCGCDSITTGKEMISTLKEQREQDQETLTTGIEEIKALLKNE